MTVCGIEHADGVCVMGECPHIKTCCPVVWDKSGKPMTNEEWFTSLSTEEKAKTIVCLEVNALHKWKKGLVKSDVDEIKRWLKEKRK